MSFFRSVMKSVRGIFSLSLPCENPVFSLWERALFVVRLVVSFCFGGDECLCCGRKALVIPLCRSCWLTFSAYDFSRRCDMCGKVLVSEISVCSSCRREPVIAAVEKVFPLHSYRFWKKTLLFDWKLGGKRVLSFYFASLLARKIREIESEHGSCFIVPVPPRPGKIREKGWDQVLELCAFLSLGWNFRVVHLLRRLSRTQQKKLGRLGRLGKIGASYALTKKKKLLGLVKKSGGNAIVLDDVITTGATVQRCAELLKEAGVGRVFAVSLFIVD